ncbi:MAG TPA: hypothetical protein P5555_15855 [Candidatus Paceibacterota bacterium]|nr:hypothetical protein [Verrucomicrobiota bacterium]HRZ46656.1 hypothetical protein [Candidatus Paceibacterota bacterium]
MAADAVRHRGPLHPGMLALGLMAAVSAASAPLDFDEAAHHSFQQSADPPAAESSLASATLDVPIRAASEPETGDAQPVGALTGRIVFTSGGHGWTWGGNGWRTQRSVLLEMNEDCGNLDQMTLFVAYCFNAGATVVPLRPVGFQSREAVLDNDSPGVTFIGPWADSTATVYFGSPGDVPYRYAPSAPAETALAIYTPATPSQASIRSIAGPPTAPTGFASFIASAIWEVKPGSAFLTIGSGKGGFTWALTGSALAPTPRSARSGSATWPSRARPPASQSLTPSASATGSATSIAAAASRLTPGRRSAADTGSSLWPARDRTRPSMTGPATMPATTSARRPGWQRK